MNIIPIIALLLGVALMLFLIMKTRVNAFMALIISSLGIALMCGLSFADSISAVTSGFGNTMTSIGIIIVLGCIMGEFLAESGAAKRIALTILKAVGVKNADVVLGLTGYIVSIPVFSDSGFIILSQLAKEFSRLTKKSVVGFSGMLVMGLYLTHFLVPPTPGPLATAANFGVDLGSFIIWGLLLALPMLLVAIPLFRYFSRKFSDVIVPDDTDLSKLSEEEKATYLRIVAKRDRGEELTSQDFNDLLKAEELPGAAISFAVIVVPLLLILANTVSGLVGLTGPIKEFLAFIGNPVFALIVSALMAMYLLMRIDRKRAQDIASKALASAGLAAFVTAAGGAMGNVIKVTEIGTILAEGIINSGIPAILVPMLVGCLLRSAQGSGATAMITGSAILAPIIPTLQLNPLLAGLALCCGAMPVSYVNDSLFWVVSNFGAMDVKTTLKSWTIASAVVPLLGCAILFVASFFV